MKSAKKRTLAFLAGLCLVTAAQSASAANPIVQTCYTADGAPLVWNDTFYLFTGHDEGNSGFFSMNDWRCFATTDMQNWTDLGVPLDYTTFKWASGEAWAAQCIERDGKFYYYVTVTAANGGGRAIGVAVADSPEGPFTDPIGKPLCGPNWSYIDPTVFVDDDGQAYLYWGNPKLWMVKLNADMISYEGQPVEVDSGCSQYTEAPYLYKHGDWYYMVYASDGIPENIAYSMSKSPTGSWEYCGIIMQNGGNSFTNHPGIADYKGHTYLTYHTGTLPGGGFTRSMCIEEMTYQADGKIKEMTRTEKGPAQLEALNPYLRTEAETICWESGVETENCSEGGRNVCDIQNGEYIKVSGVDFGSGATRFRVSASSANSGGTLELHLDSQIGTKIGTVNITGTGGWQNWQQFTCDISGASGEHDLYLTFSGSGTNPLFNLDWWQFGTASGYETVQSDRLIQALQVNDSTNAADWSVQKNLQAGSVIYGDRDITAASVPASVRGAEYIRTACDSKLYVDALGSFTVGDDIAVFAAVDSRVNASLDWLGAWTKTGEKITTSNGVSLELFRLNAKAGDTVMLGTNGGQNESANYIIMALPIADAPRVKGDVNGDGSINAVDLTLAKRGILQGFDNKKAETAADVDESGIVDRSDIDLICAYVLAKIDAFPVIVIPEPERKDTTVANPMIWSDVPDMDYLRVGDTYYMISTTMFFNPGAPIMKSTDLVSWKLCSYIYDTLEDNDTTNLLNGKSCYGNGQWAASLKYHNGKYIAFFASNDQGKSYIFQTDDIEHGTWTKYTLNGVYHDASLFFDDDGKNYLIYGSGTISIKQLNSDVTNFQPGGVSQVLMKGQWDGLCEGSHFYKIDGYYYNFVIGKWPRSEMVFRSSTLLGNYDYKTVMSTGVGTYAAGCAQGGLIDTADGKWYSIMFQDHGAVGRIPSLIPVTWQDHWPVFGVNGKVPTTLTINTHYTGTDLAASDEFDETELPLEWQWNHNPDNTKWSLTDREGWLRLKTGAIASDLLTARNSLTQRTEGPACTGSIKMDVSHMQIGDYAGLAAFQEVYGQVGVYVDGSGTKKVFMAINGDGNGEGIGCKGGVTKIVEEIPLQSDTVYFKIDYLFSTFDQNAMTSSNDIDKANFYYSYDGTTWTKIGSELSMKYKLTLFTGYRNAIFNYATKASGGYVDVDWFHYDKTPYQPALN